MSKKSLIFVLDASHHFLGSSNKIDEIEETKFFSTLNYCYLPLLRMCNRLEEEGINFKLALAFSPTLCEMLNNSHLQLRYVEHLEKTINYGMLELARNESCEKTKKIIKKNISFLQQNHKDYVESYDLDLLSKISYFESTGNFELLATTATNSFLPMYKDIPEAINSQIELGLINHRNNFLSSPNGFWLPAMAYTPGLEDNIKSYGYKYTFLETHGVLFSSKNSPGIFKPCVFENGISVFTRDKLACLEVLDENTGFYNDSVFLNTDSDIGFELDNATLEPLFDTNEGRRITGFRYWNKENGNVLYDEKKAKTAVKNYAKNFLKKRVSSLKKASKILEDSNVSLFCAFPASFFGNTWYEGVDWLESVFRQTNDSDSLKFSLPCDLIEKDNKNIVSPISSSWFKSGFSEEVLNNENDWMYPYVRKAIRRMIDLSNRFPDDTGLKERSLNMAAREVLLSQTIDWFTGMNSADTKDYSKKQFEDHVSSFTVVFESLGSSFISTEWLTKTEKKHMLFSDINYRVFREKK